MTQVPGIIFCFLAKIFCTSGVDGLTNTRLLLSEVKDSMGSNKAGAGNRLLFYLRVSLYLRNEISYEDETFDRVNGVDHDFQPVRFGFCEFKTVYCSSTWPYEKTLFAYG